MSFIDDLLGKRRPEVYDRSALRPHTPAALPPRRDQPAAPIPVAIEDKKPARKDYDREMSLAKEAWRINVLPKLLRSNWDNGEMLQAIIVRAVSDGLRADVSEAAEQLYKIDPERGVCLWSRILKEEGRLDEAENGLRDFMARFGEKGEVVLLLARIYARREDTIRSGQLLWHALELDPNLDGGIAWYAAVQRDRGGDGAWLAALRKVAVLPGSWRAQLWLARAALDAKNLEQAMAFYQESLSRAGKPAPADLLLQMSNDLGHGGHLLELLELTEPHFEVQIHGLPVGNNLLKAHLNLGRIDAARRIMEQLHALKRLEWQKTLGFWEEEIVQAGAAPASLPVEEKVSA